jgi:PAS domain S-box-containing protein
MAAVGLDGRAAARQDERPRHRPAPAPDAVAVRGVARLRVAVSLIAAATGSFLPGLHSGQRWAFLVLGLAWVPAATVVLFASDSDNTRVAVYGGPTADIAVLAAVSLFVPAARVPMLFGFVAVVAFATYTGGRAFGGGLSAASLAAIVAERSGAHRLDSSTAALFAVALVGIVFLLDRTATVQLRTAARSARVESKSEAILARVADAIVVTDGVGCILQWSPAAERILGRRAAEAVGHPCDAAAGLHVGERTLDCSGGCPLLAMAEAGDDVLGQEAWRFDIEGKRQPLLVNVSAVPGPDRTPAEVVHSLRDITRLKQAEEAKTLFLATASHELKTPLTVIAGFSDTLLSDVDIDDATRKMALEAIHRRARELGKIVDRLLLSSRIESGRVQVAEAEVDVIPLVAERVGAVRGATSVDVSLSAPAEVTSAIADPQAVITVVDHLLDNAVKYSPGGEPIEVRLWDDEAGVYISVADHGIGMDPEQAAHCFDKFWQAESNERRRFGGTGIGLYIVKSLVDAMGGRVLVDSAKGAGTTFTVGLGRFDTWSPRGEVDEAAAGADGAPGRDQADAGIGERTSIREFMRQIGVPERSKP